MHISQVMTSHSTKFWWNMMKKDISANLYKKCLILCSKILPNVLHNTSWQVLLPWQHTMFQSSPILKALAPGALAIHFDIFKWCLIYMIRKVVTGRDRREGPSSRLWHFLTFYIQELWLRPRKHSALYMVIQNVSDLFAVSSILVCLHLVSSWFACG